MENMLMTDDINEQVDVLDSLPSISRNHLVAGHIFSPTHFNPDTDTLASALDLDLNSEDVDAEDLADLFSNQEGGGRSIIDKYKPKYLLSPRGVAHIAPSESQEVGYMRPLTTFEHLAVFGKDAQTKTGGCQYRFIIARMSDVRGNAFI
eukprot:scaffold39509_cov87-Cyclotella_meneghiniana.AAC.2